MPPIHLPPKFFEKVTGKIDKKIERVLVTCYSKTVYIDKKAPRFLEHVRRDWPIGVGRQFRVEGDGLHVADDGGTQWILGHKTEGGGTSLGTTAADARKCSAVSATRWASRCPTHAYSCRRRERLHLRR